MTPPDFQLSRTPLGRLVFTTADGTVHDGVLPVRAFPLAAPDEGISMVGADGKELAWIARLSAVPAAQRSLIEDELNSREFVPEIQRLLSVSTFSSPSTWTVLTDRGRTTLVLKGEEDIRRLPGSRSSLLITSGQGIVFKVKDLLAMDRHSKKLLERFL
jgi:hypothetical protein